MGYVINKDIGNCSYYPVNTDGFKANEIEVIESNSGSFLGLKSPNDFFGLKDTAFFAGQVSSKSLNSIFEWKQNILF